MPSVSGDASPLEKVCLAASDKLSEAERAVLLDQLRHTDARMLAQLEELLLASQTDATASGTLPPHPGNPTTADDELLAGRYRLRKPIGEGGMGTVYLADQLDPVRRTVAVKRMKRGQNSREFLARFETERQALARMDHPHIARVFDGGTTPDGEPFFVMELVDGISITQFAETNQLSLESRLRLVIEVCLAVQHAHEKGILHRDLKPSNVLVALVDGRPIPKIIDFGVAKATGGRLTEITFSETGAIVGTPIAMSPEQADPDCLDIDTRSDVYALGVILYELLTGTTPIDPKRNDVAGMLDVLRRVREEAIERPSRRVRSIAQERLPRSGQSRSELARTLETELDWLLLKALEKDRRHRYGTPGELAGEIERYLRHEPILAHPPSAWYLLRKFVRRNRAATLATSLIVLTLIAGIVGTSWGLIRSVRSESLAVKRLDDVKQSMRVLGTLFAELDLTSESRDGVSIRVTLAEKLDAAARQLEQLQGEGASVELAELLQLVGKGLAQLGQVEQARASLERAFGTFRDLRGAEHPATLAVLHDIAFTFSMASQHERATTLLRQLVETASRTLGASDARTLRWEESLAKSLSDQGELREAKRICESLAVRHAKLLGTDPRSGLSLELFSAELSMNLKETAEALVLFKQVVPRIRDQFGLEDVLTLKGYQLWALAHIDLKEYSAATELLEVALPKASRNLGPDHYLTLGLKGLLAECYRKQSQHPRAILLFEEIVERYQRRFGWYHANTLAHTNNLANAFVESNQVGRGIALLEKVVEIGKEVHGVDHPERLASVYNLGFVLAKYKNDEKGLELLREVLRGYEKHYGGDHASTVLKRWNLAQFAIQFGKVEEFQTQWAILQRDYATLYAKDSEKLVERFLAMTTHLNRVKQPALAWPILDDLLEHEKGLSERSVARQRLHFLRGEQFRSEKKWTEAEKEYLIANDLTGGVGAVARPSIERLIEVYREMGSVGEAEKWQSRLREAGK
jgi:serine/threonine protein kinase/tetratricopeptide (TPR) repeat protein